MKLKINKPQRYAKMRAHTATHILHAEIEKIVNNTKQAGSYVDEDYLRFDFQSEQQLSSEQIFKIETQINQIIYKAIPVKQEEMSIEKATKLWAKAFFKDKYWDLVRVISITNGEKNISTELCWWCHVTNTKAIWAFKIIGQEAVASGIKRIIAITGPKVSIKFQEQEKNQEKLAQKLWVSTKQFPDKLEKAIKEFQELQTKYTAILDQQIWQNLQKLYSNAKWNTIFHKILKINKDSNLANTNFKLISQHAKNLWNQTILIYNETWNFIIIAEESQSAKKIAKELKLRGGWNDKIVQWKDWNIEKILS